MSRTTLIVPNDTAYPPEAQELLPALPQVEADPFAVAEVISNGRRLWVKGHIGAHGQR